MKSGTRTAVLAFLRWLYLLLSSDVQLNLLSKFSSSLLDIVLASASNEGWELL